MKKWRIRTKEEFVSEGLWINDGSIQPDGGYPKGWNKTGSMNNLIGKDIPENLYSKCEESRYITLNDRWTIDRRNYVSYDDISNELIVHTPESTLENPKFDFTRLATEVDNMFAQKLTKSSEEFLKIFNEFDSKYAKKTEDIMTNLNSIYASIRTDLIAEVSRGRTIINLPDGREVPVLHLDHPEMENVIKSINMQRKAMLVGPAGTGKTYMVAEIANRLNLPFYKYSCSRDSSVHDLLGYKQPASETYLETVFLQAYENGGIFLVDEYDAMSGDMALFFNGIADGSKFISIPHRDNKPIATKHKDFILIMCGNTWGKGSIDYSGRDFQDMALMDRFRFCRHFIGYNIALEKSFSGTNFVFIEKLRKNLEKVGSYLSTRNIEDIAKLMSTGITKKIIVDMVITDLEDDSKKVIYDSLS